MIGTTLHRFKKDARYVAWDVEAEGLNLGFHRPFQISYALATNKEILDIKTSFIWWPDLDISEDAARITKFNYQDYKSKARPAAEVLAEFDAVLYDRSIESVWQNGLNYDYYMHKNWRRACGKPIDDSYLIRSIDMMQLSKALKLGIAPDISTPEAFLVWQYRVADIVRKGLRTNLEVCGKEEKIDYDPNALHDAAYDITLMMKIFYKRLYQLEF